MNKLSVSFANIKNVQTNYLFAQKLMKENDITFLSETWLSELNKNFLFEISSDSKVFSRSDFITVTKGRPFGGVGWIIDDQIKILHHEFMNDRISYIVVQQFDIKWLIIGVYMSFDNNKIDSLSEFDDNLAIISELVNSYRRMGDYNIIVGGDFNADLNRKKRFDRRLCSFIKKEKLLICENLKEEKNQFTYFVNNYKACLDHVFMFNTDEFINNNKPMIISKISKDLINTSDHHPVSVDINYTNVIIDINNTPQINVENNEKTNLIKIYPDFDDIEIKNTFASKVEILLREKMSTTSSTDNQININNTFININKSIKEAYDSLITHKTRFYKTNEWWSKELKDIKNEMLNIKKKKFRNFS